MAGWVKCLNEGPVLDIFSAGTAAQVGRSGVKISIWAPSAILDLTGSGFSYSATYAKLNSQAYRFQYSNAQCTAELYAIEQTFLPVFLGP